MSTLVPGALQRRTRTEKNAEDVYGASAEKEKGLDSASSNESIKSIPPLGEPPESGPTNFWSRWRSRPVRNLDAIATQPSVFDDPRTLETYRPPPQYENVHRFDPNARWTWGEEQKIVRKIDLKIMLWMFVTFFTLELDRSNISQANTDNFLGDLHITTDDFNLGNTVFRIAFLSAELPSQLVSKRVGPDIWIPCQMVLWSIVAMSQFWLTGRSSFLATRALLGLLQGGFIPDVILYLSYYYTKTELPIRLAYFWVSNYAADVIAAFLAIGLLQIHGETHRAGWRYLFLIEGGMTFVVGALTFLLMFPGPTQTKTWLFPKGLFTEREEVIMVNRVLRDDPSKSDMHNRQGLDIKQIWEAICDWHMWPLYLLGLTFLIPPGPPQTYLTLILRKLGFNTTQSNLLSIPGKLIGVIGLLASSYVSELIDSRVLCTVWLQFWLLPLLIALYTFNNATNPWVYYAVITLIVGYPYVHPVQVAWASRNSYSVRTRTVSASVYNMFVQAGTVVYSNIYQKNDAPLYKHGNLALIMITIFNIFFYAFTWWFYRAINRSRDRKWNAMTPEEQREYLETTTDKGNEKLDFRFAY